MVFAISAPIVNLLQPGSGLIANAMNDPETFIHGANILLNHFTDPDEYFYEVILIEKPLKTSIPHTIAHMRRESDSTLPHIFIRINI